MNPKTRTLLAAAIASVVAFPALAQQSPTIRSIVRYQLKSDRIGDFQAALKDQTALMKEVASDRYRTVWVAQSGPREYVIVRYHPNWADLDVGPDPKMKGHETAITQILTRMNQCVEHASRVIDQIQTDMSVPSNGDVPKMVRVMRSVVKPDRVDDYMALIKAEILPAAKKAGMQEYAMSRTRYGGPSSEFRSVVGISGWADFDGMSPIVKAMGEENFKRFAAKVTPMIQESEVGIYRYRPDLSYLPSAPMSTADRKKQ